MSEHATTASATPFAEHGERKRPPTETRMDWTLAAALTAAVLSLYAVSGVAVYLLITTLT
jgi:hypothetical protein